MRVLVTGAGGRIGRAVVRQLRERGDVVTGLDRPNRHNDDVDDFVAADACAPDAVAEAFALAEVDAVVHLAALPSPEFGTPGQVFAVNTQATFTVLEAAGQAGIRTAVIAGSLGATGMPWSSREPRPPYLPLDVDAPGEVEDPYGLSKNVDELTGAMMARRHGLAVTALRFPFVGSIEDRLPERARRLTDAPQQGARELWSYLETRDAARAVALALDASRGGSLGGFRSFYVAAAHTCVPYRSEELARRYLPEAVLRVPLPGRTGLLDLGPAERLLGFRAEYELELEERELPTVFAAG